MALNKKIKVGDTIGVVAPSRPICLIRKRIDEGIKKIKTAGFQVKLGKYVNERTYYSAGTAKQRAEDFNNMFADKEVNAIFCATGGCSANQILPLLDYDLISKNPKPIVGYSDITNLLLGIYTKTGLVTYHGPGISGLSRVDKESGEFLFDLLTSAGSRLYPGEMEVIKHGKVHGPLIGGNLFVSMGLLGTPYSPNYDGAVWFWEDVHISPADIDFSLNHFKNSGNLDKISAMIIGHISHHEDKRHPEYNRPIDEIVLEVTKDYNFPIIMVDYFGHDIKHFLTFPVGVEGSLDTKMKKFEIYP